MTPAAVDPGVFADAQSLASLKRQAAAHDPKALGAAARQFESLFIDMMLKSARAANFKDPLFGSSQTNLYQDLYDQQLSVQLSKTHTFGLAEMLVQQLRRQWSGAGSPAAGAAASSAASGSAAAVRPAERSLGTATARLSPPAPGRGGAALPDAAQQSAFARSLWPDAQRAAQHLGVSPVSLIAQAALETDWGRRLPRTAAGTSSNNLFGIKASRGSGPSVTSATHEYRQGIETSTQAQFRAYESCRACFQDYTSLLSGTPRYAAALGTGNDVGAFATALQRAGYATDPNYARKLTEVAATLTRTLSASTDGGPLKRTAAEPIPTSSRSL